jgi:glycosidase
VPLLEVASHTTTATGAETHLRLARASRGADVATVTARLVREGADLPLAPTPTVTGADVAIALAGLTAGKYTLVVEATDSAGKTAVPVRVPFWIESDAFDWHDALIYMVMTDRFRDGDPSNDPAPSPGADVTADYHGGDLRGVTQAIDDGTFDTLGVRALWLSPFVENTTDVEQENGHGVTAYHGYWPTRARAVDPRLGTAADLEAMVTAAHRHGIRVLMDYVINHVHEDHEYYAAHPSWFRVGCTCGDPDCGWTEHRLDCSFHPYMPDVDWTNKDAGEQMIADALWWLERFDLDGLRVDAVKHVEDLAITNLATRINETFEGGGTEYFLLGETAMGWAGDDVAANLPEYDTISRYVGPNALSGQFDFVLYHATAYRVWADDERGMLHLDYWTKQSLAHYPVDAVMTPFVGSHDSERITSLAYLTSSSASVHHKWVSEGLPAAPSTDEPYQRATLALTWLLGVPGAPLLYYGDEYGEYGGADPDNRHMWRAPAQRDARQTAMAAKVARAGQLRRELAPLRRGRYMSLTVTEDVLTFGRVLDNQAVVVAINRAGAARTVDVDLAPLAGVTLGASLTDRLDPAGRTVAVSGGHVMLDLPARSAMILAP